MGPGSYTPTQARVLAHIYTCPRSLHPRQIFLALISDFQPNVETQSPFFQATRLLPWVRGTQVLHATTNYPYLPFPNPWRYT